MFNIRIELKVSLSIVVVLSSFNVKKLEDAARKTIRVKKAVINNTAYTIIDIVDIFKKF